METASFFQDLAVILVATGAVSALFTRLGWPKVIGYILVGAVLGKYTFGGSFVVDQKNIELLGQVGVVFLMFALGLEFSIRKLRKVGHVIFPTALIDMVIMIWLGHFVGTKILGWGFIQSFFLGAAISDSATTLLAKTIDEMGWRSRRFTKYIFGITITEDIICIGVIALLTGLVQSGSMQLGKLVYSLGGLMVFLTGVSVFGLLLVPRTMNRVGKLKDDESLLLTMLGFCFLVSFIAAKLNFSLALGAFLVGVMGAESQPLKRIYQQCIPLRTLFSAIFFVTIGLLIDPTQMILHWKSILGITALVIVGKSVNCTVGSLLTGQDLKNALQTGLGLAQIGEFAYLVALIGMTMHVVDSSFYQIAVGVSILTTILNPFLLRISDPLADGIEKRLPLRWKELLEAYANWTERFLHRQTTDEITKIIRFNVGLLILQWILVAVIFIAAGLLARIDYTQISPCVENYKTTLLWGAACLLTVPNAIFLMLRARALGHAVADAVIFTSVKVTPWAHAFRRVAGFVFMVACMIILFVETVMLSGSIMPEQGWARVIVLITFVLVGFIGWNRFRHLGADSLQMLQGVLTQDHESEPSDSMAGLLDVHTERVVLTATSLAVNRSLRALDLRARTGASVVGIERLGKMMINPTADTLLAVDDVVILLGDEEQVAEALDLLTRKHIFGL